MAGSSGEGRGPSCNPPCALENFEDCLSEAKRRGTQVCVFLDYDGTLSPIVNDPDKAEMSEEMRRAVNRVSEKFRTSIISGRALEKVKNFVKLDHLYYAGSHGLDIEGPAPPPKERDEGEDEPSVSHRPPGLDIELVREVRHILEQKTKGIQGVTIEDNKFCCSVHFRNSSPDSIGDIEAIVRDVVEAKGLQMKKGRKVFEVRPQITWNKGHALSYLLNTVFKLADEESFPIYLGDDKTDEDAFAKIKEMGTGCGILVSTVVKPTVASYSVREPRDVLAFLEKLAAWDC
ncbi:trehalose 6-phosphate phosphatase [Chloropicon primus]|nr:trehalose 6-phosphate phosphatase [Chloropicon primus]